MFSRQLLSKHSHFVLHFYTVSHAPDSNLLTCYGLNRDQNYFCLYKGCMQAYQLLSARKSREPERCNAFLFLNWHSSLYTVYPKFLIYHAVLRSTQSNPMCGKLYEPASATNVLELIGLDLQHRRSGLVLHFQHVDLEGAPSTSPVKLSIIASMC